MKKRHALYLIGEPGSGKSTLMEYLTADLPYEEYDQPFAFRRYDCGPLELGKRRDKFSGTDALALNVQPAVERWVEGILPALLLAEGDRLANDKFWAHLIELGYTLHIYQLWGPQAAARQRLDRGTQQDERWIAGRVTKVTGLRKRWGGIVLPVGAPLAELAERMTDPVAAALKEAKEAAA